MKSPSIQPASVIDLTPEEFAQLSDRPKLIDVRSGVEYSLFHAPEAVNLDLSRIVIGRLPILQTWVLPAWFRSLPKTEPIAVVCLTAHRSPIAAQQLVKAGFTKVYNLTGGMLAWQKADLPLSRGRSQPLAD